MSNRVRRTQAERNAATRKTLIDVARAQFVHEGYVATTTNSVVESAAVTRGALYHHFASKHDLFRGVVVSEAAAVAAAIAQATPEQLPPLDSLLAGASAFLGAMAVPGRTRLLLVDGPSILGHDEMRRIDTDNALDTLVDGLRAAFGKRRRVTVDMIALADLISAALDQAALSIERGSDEPSVRSAVEHLLRGVLNTP